MDHRKRMLRAVRLFGWGGVVLSVTVALVRMLTQDTGQQVAIAAWTAANVVNMIAVTMLAYLLRVRPGLRPRLRSIKTGMYVTNLVVQGGLLAVAGGVDTALWLVMLPTVLFAAADTSKGEAAMRTKK